MKEKAVKNNLKVKAWIKGMGLTDGDSVFVIVKRHNTPEGFMDSARNINVAELLGMMEMLKHKYVILYKTVNKL